MDNITKNAFELGSLIKSIPYIWDEFKKNPDENGEKIAEILEKSEKKFLQIKNDVVIMINNMIEERKKEDVKEEVEGIPSDNGFLIKKDKKE